MKSLLVVALLFATNALAESPAPAGNLSSKFDLLEGRLAVLEKENAQLRRQMEENERKRSELLARVAQLESKAKKGDALRLAEILPKEESEKKTFFEKFRREMKSDSDRASGKWTNPEAWASIRKRMTSYQVRQVLGNPTRIRQSANPGVEQVYLYEGDLNADGEKERGFINFKDKRIVSFQSPH